MQKFLMFIIAILVLGGCSANVQKGVEYEHAKGEYVYKVNSANEKNLSYKILAQGETPVDELLYMDAKAQTKIFYSDDSQQKVAFFDLYKKLTGKVADDFNGVALVAMEGTKSTGGYGIDIQKVEDRGSAVEVQLVYKQPSKGAIVTQAFTSPYLLLVIPYTHKEIKVSVSEK